MQKAIYHEYMASFLINFFWVKMNISDLNRNELIALAGLIRLVLLADRVLSEAEQEKLDTLINAVGVDKFRVLLDDFDKCCNDMEHFKIFLQKIDRLSVRIMIYNLLFEMATIETVSPVESDVLEWLATQWDIDMGLYFNTELNGYYES